MKDPRIPPSWWPSEEEHLLFDCALRFDGEKLDRELGRGLPAPATAQTYPALHRLYTDLDARALERLEDLLPSFGVLFFLQRAHKWQDMLSDADRLLYLQLFLHLHDVDVPAGYEWADFLRSYEAQRHEARALALRLRPVVARQEKRRARQTGHGGQRTEAP
jgi:hypothetical protein